MNYNNTNALLNNRLQSLSEEDKNYWSFKGKSKREYGHGLFQYPAMMVPQVTQAIIDNILNIHPEFKTVCDPFVGSGTVMTESMIRGLSFWGTDINPLAILLCQVKEGPFFITELKAKSEILKKRIERDNETYYEVDFNNKGKWFTKGALINLSKIRRSIRKEKDLWARKFFWIAMAETIRLTSNSRTSTFKLHIRTEEDINERKNSINILDVFYNVLRHNLLEYHNLFKKLEEKKLLQGGYYKQEVNIAFADTRTANNTVKADMIITSPPYGDNLTTVPYGQHSYLPLQWIDFSDIDSNLNKDILLKTTNTIDSKSLGGHKILADEEMLEIVQQSESLKKYVSFLKHKSDDKLNKVVSFFTDLNLCIEPILKNLNSGGVMVWVLGNRRVCEKKVPLDKILSDLFEKHNVSVFCELKRKIPSKRMASKNNLTKTMSDEVILLMRRDK